MGVNYNLGLIDPLVIRRPLRPEWDTFHAINRPDHYGVDAYPDFSKLEVISASDGKVRFTREEDLDSAGTYSEILYQEPGDQGWYLLRYLHLVRGSNSHLSVGSSILQGSKIGICDTTGNANSAHLHMDVRYSPHPEADKLTVHGSRWGTPYNPQRFGLFGGVMIPDLVTITVDKPMLRVQTPPYTPSMAVKELQSKLAIRGFLDLTPGVNFDPETLTFDGKFGPSTEKGVVDYQRSKGLVDDGIVGAATWSVISDY